MSAPIEIVFSPGGAARWIHDDRFAGRAFAEALGAPLRISRASAVEPNADGRWTADLAPVGGPVLGPFDTRGEALAAEVAWLRANVIGGAA